MLARTEPAQARVKITLFLVLSLAASKRIWGKSREAAQPIVTQFVTS